MKHTITFKRIIAYGFRQFQTSLPAKMHANKHLMSLVCSYKKKGYTQLFTSPNLSNLSWLQYADPFLHRLCQKRRSAYAYFGL